MRFRQKDKTNSIGNFANWDSAITPCAALKDKKACEDYSNVLKKIRADKLGMAQTDLGRPAVAQNGAVIS